MGGSAIPVTCAPSLSSLRHSHPPLKPVCPVTNTLLPRQNFKSMVSPAAPPFTCPLVRCIRCRRMQGRTGVARREAKLQIHRQVKCALVKTASWSQPPAVLPDVIAVARNGGWPVQVGASRKKHLPAGRRRVLHLRLSGASGAPTLRSRGGWH